MASDVHFFQRLLCAVLMIAGSAAGVVDAYATTIAKTTLAEAMANSELVFEGKVVATEVRSGQGSPYPKTCVTMQVIDVIAGKYGDPTVVLCFAGGSDGKTATAIDDLQIPQLGEHGIYFVTSLSGQFVNPLYGWAQGHFIVQDDPMTGTPKVVTAHHKAVISILPHDASSGAATTAHDVAADVVAGSVLDITHAVSVETFKSLLRSLH